MQLKSLMSLGTVLLGVLGFWNGAAAMDGVPESKPARTPINGPIVASEHLDTIPKVVYGTDDRIDVYQETNPDRLDWAASTCGLFFNSSVRNNNDGTYTIRTSSYDVCPDEPFSNQPKAAFCSGFMVGDDIIATAGHCFDPSDLNDVWFVFGFVMDDANTPVVTVSADRVYRGVELLDRKRSGDLDHAIIRVDREIIAPGAMPFLLRREGVVAIGAPVGVIGHPAGIPLKLAFGDNTRVRENDNAGYFVANLDTYGGNSGSPVIDPTTGMVEGILVRGETDFVDVGGCLRSNILSNSGGDGEEVSKTINFIDSVPEFISSNAVLTLDDASYGCDDVLSIILRDEDLAGSGPVSVALTTSGGDVENGVLAETGTTGEFFGMFALGGGTITTDNGTLEVSNGQTITASFVDATHGPGAPDIVTASASVDCTAPVISEVSVTQIGAQYATVVFTTDEPTSGRVRAGGACGDTDVQAEFSQSTTHSVLLQGLFPLNDYYVIIEASDEAGNTAVSDNGGACFHFATMATTQYYTEAFTGQLPDLANSSVTFTPEEGGGYLLCREAISALPVVASGSTPLLLSDDAFAQVVLSNGATFPYYGVSYDRLYVNSNGNVTFDSGDDSPAFTIDAHFGRLRVAPCLVDLNPEMGGSVWHRQLGDRFVVTWESVPHFSYHGSNTLQLELFFDGTIRFSYLGLTGFPAVVGLSAGLGVLTDFVSTDLSAQVTCGAGVERYHSADTDNDFIISLQELLRLIQFFNIGDYHCDTNGEDGYAPGPGDHACTPHDSDFKSQDWKISMSEVLRLVQLYNSAGYVYDPENGVEDGFVHISAK